MTHRTIPLLLILLSFITSTFATTGFDPKVFKKCNQHDFCENLRPGDFQKQAQYAIQQLEDSSFQAPREFLTFRLHSLNSNDKWELSSDEQNSPYQYPRFMYQALDVTVSLYAPATFRIQIKEDQNTHKTPVEHVVVAEALTKDSLKWRNEKEHIEVHTTLQPTTKVLIHKNPFRVELVQDGEVSAVFNRDSFLYVDSKEVKRELEARVTKQNAEATTTTTSEDGTTQAPLSVPDRTGNYRHTTVHSDDIGGASSFDVFFPQAQHVYGIPERATDLSLKSTTGKEPYRLFNADVFRFELDNHMGLYGSIPFMFSLGKSAASAGVFALNPSNTFIDVDKSAVESGSRGIATHWMHEAGLLDVFLIPGPTPKQVLQNYIHLTGKPMLPQLFSMAYHQCRWNYKDEQDVEQVDEKFDEFNIPYDVLWLDIEHTDGKKYFTWEKHDFPTPLKMQEQMKAKGRKMVTITDPHIKRESGYFVHDEAEAKGYYVKDRNGKSFEGDCWPGKSSWLDFFSPEVRDWYASLFKYDKYKGSTDILYNWIDMNEPSVFNSPEITMPPDNLHYGGKTHREVHNMYGYFHGVAAHKGHLVRSDNQDRPFILTRSFFAGSQRYVAAWTGDNTATWEHLRKTPAMLMGVSLGGFPFIGSDVGGFFDNPDTEMLIRWYQSGAFYPFFRAHAHIETKRREVWLFGENPLALMREAIIRRYVLLPYYYTLAFQASRTGLPIIRPLFMEYTNDETVYEEQNQFLVGTDLMVVPITEKEQQTASVYFPGKGAWYEWSDGSLVTKTGPVRHTVRTPLEYTPVYQRGGSIIPVKERVRRSSTQMRNDPYTLRVALSHKNDARGELYIDDGHSYKFRDGRYSMREFRVVPDMRTSKFTISNKEGSAEGADTKPDATYRTTISNEVERIVISGVTKEPKRVFLEKNDASASQSTETRIDLLVLLDFDYDTETHKLIIRKPGVLIRDDWEIHVE